MKRRAFIKALGAGAMGLMVGGCDFQSPFEKVAEEEKPVQNFAGSVEYREILHGGVKVSTVALGAGALHQSSEAQIERIVAYAADQGINLLDTVMSDLAPAEAIGRALKSRRDKVITQMHIGVQYPGNVYLRTRDLKRARDGFQQQLKAFGTNYSDIGMIHYVDDAADFQAVMENGVLEYAQKLKQDGTIRLIGLSSHSVEISRRFLETGLIDVLMFSLNPAYDFTPTDQGLQVAVDRKALYEEAQKRGTAITVMKVYSGGKLLSDSTSPFGKAMTPTQCIQYALDRPAVVSCVAGVRNMQDMADALKYYTASAAERDYSFIWGAQQANMAGVCIYCNHCQPCPVGIDIGMVGKYYDLAKAGDGLAREHYLSLRRTAGDCNNCGECETRCPFQVKIREHMKEVAQYFGR